MLTYVATTASAQVDTLLGLDDMNAWKEHFAPTDGSSQTSYVSLQWVNFISLTLLTPDKFDWVKSFLRSQMLDIILSRSDGHQCINFSIPDVCPFVLDSCMLAKFSRGGSD